MATTTVCDRYGTTKDVRKVLVKITQAIDGKDDVLLAKVYDLGQRGREWLVEIVENRIARLDENAGEGDADAADAT